MSEPIPQWVVFSKHVVLSYLSKAQFERQSLVFLYEFYFGSCLMVYIFCFCLDFSWWWTVTWEVLAGIYPFFPNCFWVCFLMTAIETITRTILLLYFCQEVRYIKYKNSQLIILFPFLSFLHLTDWNLSFTYSGR